MATLRHFWLCFWRKNQSNRLSSWVFSWQIAINAIWLFFPNIIRTYTVCSIDYVDLWNRSVLAILWPTTTKTHLVYQVVKRWIAPLNAHWNYSVFSVFKKSNHYVPCYRLKLQLLLNFAKVAFFDHHTSTYLLTVFPTFWRREAKK